MHANCGVLGKRGEKEETKKGKFGNFGWAGQSSHVGSELVPKEVSAVQPAAIGVSKLVCVVCFGGRLPA